MMAKTGDTVRFLNSVGGGRIVRIDGNVAYVDEDGFETPVMLRECVVVSEAGDSRAAASAAPAVAPKEIEKPSKEVKAEPELPIVETEGGDKLNVVLGYEPADIKQLSTTRFDISIVNDSNYYLYFTYLTRGDEEEWTTRYAGIVEPNIQLLIGEMTHADLAHMEHVAVQMIAFKRDKGFAMKRPVDVEKRMDLTRFLRVNCFRPNDYFERDVIALPIVTDDVQLGHEAVSVKPEVIAEAMLTPGERRPERRQVKKVQRQPRTSGGGDPLVTDLHIDELLDTTAGMSPAEILNYQVDEFRKVMDANMHNRARKLIFIHGKGEGVLRQALMKELRHRYKSCQVQDASFREYGFGATQVTIG
ncbi:DUF2027 domain-containing protein [Paramuribaculum intestinale]|uniref:DUF2027 domain-containing protein n=1 Tax=Paramuribaculum intestinale TaxID=2094151 RepID=UPI0025A97BCA|nr:DUF2027 domain-containing protein [Paramuribaculum intestinale]